MLRFILTMSLLSVATACTPSASTQSFDWDHINYAEVACGKGKSSDPGCKADEDSIASAGRGKGR